MQILGKLCEQSQFNEGHSNFISLSLMGKKIKPFTTSGVNGIVASYLLNGE